MNTGKKTLFRWHKRNLISIQYVYGLTLTRLWIMMDKGPETRNFDVFYASTKGWTNSGVAGDLKRHDVHVSRHCDVTRYVTPNYDDVIKWKLFPREGNPPVTGGFPHKRPVTRGFDLRLNKGLSIQSRIRWFETPSRSLLRHCNDVFVLHPCGHANAIHRMLDIDFDGSNSNIYICFQQNIWEVIYPYIEVINKILTLVIVVFNPTRWVWAVAAGTYLSLQVHPIKDCYVSSTAMMYRATH